MDLTDFPSADIIDAYIRASDQDAIWQDLEGAFSVRQVDFVKMLRLIVQQEAEVSLQITSCSELR